jgi:hypothetical protein
MLTTKTEPLRDKKKKKMAEPGPKMLIVCIQMLSTPAYILHQNERTRFEKGSARRIYIDSTRRIILVVWYGLVADYRDKSQ